MQGALDRVVDAIAVELERIRARWGDHDYGDLVMLAVLVEEVGEVARHLQPGSTGTAHEIRSELIQVAAVAQRWAALIDHRAAP